MREGSVTNNNKKGILLVWSLFLFLALLSIINLLQMTYFPVIHRANIESTIHIVLISDQIDSALVMLFAALSSFFIFLVLRRFSGNQLLALSPLIILNLSVILFLFGALDLALVLMTVGVSCYILLTVKVMKQIIGITELLLSILCFIEAGSLINWLTLPLMESGFLNIEIFSRLSNIEAQLFYVPADLTPVAMLLLLFSFPLCAAINWLRSRTVELGKDNATLRQFDLKIDGRILLVIAVLVTAFITSYPYLPSVNSTGKYVGTDIYYYSQWLGEMEAHPKQAIEFVIHDSSSRPLFLLLLYYLRNLLQVPTIPFLEWVAVPIFCFLPVSVYCFGTLVNGRAFAGLAAIFSSFSINIVVGIYTAYYSNILALSILYLALTFLLFSIKRSSYPYMVLSCILSISTIFIHPWTWAFILVILILYMGIRVLHIIIVLHSDVFLTMNRLWPILVFIATNIMADLIKALTLVVPSGIGISYDIASTRMGLGEFLRLGFNLNFTFKFFAGGYFNNLSAIVLAIIGIWWLIRKKGTSRDIQVAWLSLSSIPTLFVDFWLNERIFYNLPIQVLSTTGLLYLYFTFYPNRKFLPNMLLLVVVLLNLNYALRSVANLI